MGSDGRLRGTVGEGGADVGPDEIRRGKGSDWR